MINWNRRYASEICGCGDPAVGKDAYGNPSCENHKYTEPTANDVAKRMVDALGEHLNDDEILEWDPRTPQESEMSKKVNALGIKEPVIPSRNPKSCQVCNAPTENRSARCNKCNVAINELFNIPEFRELTRREDIEGVNEMVRQHRGIDRHPAEDIFNSPVADESQLPPHYKGNKMNWNNRYASEDDIKEMSNDHREFNDAMDRVHTKSMETSKDLSKKMKDLHEMVQTIKSINNPDAP